jgi:tRNA A37 threonylcarbamoyladenosine synthetase subunit TsaC/SUA5/YrdC
VYRPLLCTSVHMSDEDGIEMVFDGATMMSTYPDIDFVVDSGFLDSAPSTIVDMTEDTPRVLRVGRGDPDPFNALL